MDDDGKFRGASLAQLAAKHLLLNFLRRMIVEIVESHLSPGDHARVPREFVETLEMFRRGEFRFMRMNADGRVNPVVLLGEWDGRIQQVRPCAAADGQ